jgi:hypothetical protein
MTFEFPDEVDQRRRDEACRRADAIGDFLRQRPVGSAIDDVVPAGRGAFADAANLRIWRPGFSI